MAAMEGSDEDAAKAFNAAADFIAEADEDELDTIDGDQRAFVEYIAGLTDQEPGDARDEIREWLTGELPSDVVMDPEHDNHSIMLSEKYVAEGEDEYDDDRRFGDGE